MEYLVIYLFIGIWVLFVFVPRILLVCMEAEDEDEEL